MFGQLFQLTIIFQVKKIFNLKRVLTQDKKIILTEIGNS